MERKSKDYISQCIRLRHLKYMFQDTFIRVCVYCKILSLCVDENLSFNAALQSNIKKNKMNPYLFR